MIIYLPFILVYHLFIMRKLNVRKRTTVLKDDYKLYEICKESRISRTSIMNIEKMMLFSVHFMLLI